MQQGKSAETPPRGQAPKRKRVTKAQQREATIAQILDAGEYLFSRRGFFGVTLKDIAEEVGVHTSLIHYYFDDKEALFEQVVARRAPLVNEKRVAAMDRYEREAGGDITVAGALHAFLDTNLELYDSGEEWRNYGALAGLINNSSEWGARLMDDNFDSAVLRLVELLRKALPDCSEADLFWGYHFVSGALTLTLARTGRIDKLSGGACDSNDFAAVRQRMAEFMAAGFTTVCGRSKGPGGATG
ncbi:TetR/AcrR family transcriptional regulator [Pelagerythrobacter sp.]|uniref:TetR/AcrR family transcriptional regulator n=1 Tax=Pelagerythrobacter sp. TaxID=2800702 RepID=UPI0035B15CE3